MDDSPDGLVLCPQDQCPTGRPEGEHLITSDLLSTFLHWWKPWWLQWSPPREEPLCDLSWGHLRSTVHFYSTETTHSAVMRTAQGRVEVNLPEGMVSESVESKLLHSASGFSAPVSCGTIRAGWGANMAEVTTALCAARRHVRL